MFAFNLSLHNADHIHGCALPQRQQLPLLYHLGRRTVSLLKGCAVVAGQWCPELCRSFVQKASTTGMLCCHDAPNRVAHHSCCWACGCACPAMLSVYHFLQAFKREPMPTWPTPLLHGGVARSRTPAAVPLTGPTPTAALVPNRSAAHAGRPKACCAVVLAGATCYTRCVWILPLTPTIAVCVAWAASRPAS